MKAAIVFIGDDLTCMIAKYEPVALKKQGCNRFEGSAQDLLPIER